MLRENVYSIYIAAIVRVYERNRKEFERFYNLRLAKRNVESQEDQEIAKLYQRYDNNII